ncbi:integral membrane protein Srb [Dictyocaulus viviparus]|uniref:Integral membrane protein Srb n=1 Tax=Dictyocaulus viviparus TaxID=29172 RepID=A0A0D8Y5B1_DICVI|nr:integral membrane protein Srb [Dictyocaulus viviparus]
MLSYSQDLKLCRSRASVLQSVATVDRTSLAKISSDQNKKMNEITSDSNCRKRWLEAVEYPLFRVFQVIYMILSMAALPILIYVQLKHIFGPTFHQNIKMILLIYYSLALFHAMAYSTTQIYALISSLMNRPCNSFPTSSIYALLHLSIFAADFGLVLTLVALCCERSVATMRASKYERKGVGLGLLLLAATFGAIFAAICYVYDVDDFQVKVLTFVMLPPGAVKEYNEVEVANIIVSLLCIITLYIASRINKKRSSSSPSTLSTRYQMRENIVTTQFAAQIAILQVTFFVFQAVGGLSARILGKNLIQYNEKLYTSLCQMFYVAPIFIFVLPIYSLHKLKYYQTYRNEIIRTIVNMESRVLIFIFPHCYGCIFVM